MYNTHRRPDRGHISILLYGVPRQEVSCAWRKSFPSLWRGRVLCSLGIFIFYKHVIGCLKHILLTFISLLSLCLVNNFYYFYKSIQKCPINRSTKRGHTHHHPNQRSLGPSESDIPPPWYWMICMYLPTMHCSVHPTHRSGERSDVSSPSMSHYNYNMDLSLAASHLCDMKVSSFPT